MNELNQLYIYKKNGKHFAFFIVLYLQLGSFANLQRLTKSWSFEFGARKSTVYTRTHTFNELIRHIILTTKNPKYIW